MLSQFPSLGLLGELSERLMKDASSNLGQVRLIKFILAHENGQLEVAGIATDAKRDLREVARIADGNSLYSGDPYLEALCHALLDFSGESGGGILNEFS